MTQQAQTAKINEDKLDTVKKALKDAGLDFIVTRRDESIAHLNIWIGD